MGKNGVKSIYLWSTENFRKLIAMSSDLESSIRSIEEANDPDNAYFSYAVDDTGEYGVIKANKEGLRLYAADLLKKSLAMEEESPKTDPLFFAPRDWIYSDTGYNLIAGVLPQYLSRREIISKDQQPVRQALRQKKKPVLMVVLMCITGAVIMLVTLKAFPNLRSWVNIR
jgi:hypothetical protein